MKLISRAPRLSPAELAEVEQTRIRTEDERRRLADAFAREQADADRADRRRAEREKAREVKKARKAKARARARRRATLHRWASTARYVAPLLLVNLAAVGGQTAYAFTRTPESWPVPARIAVALVYAATVESISLYVNWHAHDALLQGATGTAAEMRRRAYAIAAVVAVMNYSHFDGEHWAPTPFAVGSGMASLLSPWLWGLHTRRAQHVQLLRKDLLDETGAVFDRKRRRAFPIRTWKAERWSIEHNVRDPRQAWAGYHAERDAKRARAPHGRARWAWAVLRGRAVANPVKPAPKLVLDESDPGVQVARRLRQQMQVAQEAIRPQLGRLAVVGHSLGLWPAGPAAPTTGTAAARAPTAVAATKPTTRTRAVVARTDHAATTKTRQKSTTNAATKPATTGAEADRTAAAYATFVADHGRPPSGTELAAMAGVSKSYANNWKRDNATTVKEA
ncbi:hypothetical protein GA0070622_0876 [Micromonospora sediminicola]|uniref:DUF2637 domain-containing protein n=1 Tax=Micromonospora sediminicola TaxID=946078 RepID=A0A1A9B470_9ACTN|nr:hypothetical protein [Micromonospora sediminicola]SBT63908.1 hypothetical protein GA0070622_0876 [Micromonospora sediminicola]